MTYVINYTVPRHIAKVAGKAPVIKQSRKCVKKVETLSQVKTTTQQFRMAGYRINSTIGAK